MSASIERIEVLIVSHGSGPERERTRKVTFLLPEKIAALRADRGALGAVLEDHARMLRGDEPTGQGPIR